MCNKTLLFILSLVAVLSTSTQAFTTKTSTSRTTWGAISSSSLSSTTTDTAVENTKQDDTNEQRESLKRTMLLLGASYDRGFGASPRAREQAESTIASLELLNQESNAALGISGNTTSPLQGSWRMVWTNAQDVLVLGASPISTIGAIYQVFEPPVVTNIIDFIPRIQALVPPSLAIKSLVRANVTTRAFARPNKPNRVGLSFEKVALQPIEFLGQTVDTLPPLGFDLPKLSIAGMNGEEGPGYFDVTFLDDEMLVIRQNAPGGLFVLVKVTENDP